MTDTQLTLDDAAAPEDPEYIREGRARALAVGQFSSVQQAELERVESWSWERLDYPKHGRAAKRQREAVTVSRHPAGWLSRSAPYVPARCHEGGLSVAVEDRQEYRRFHGDGQELHPVVWRVRVAVKGSRKPSWKGGFWCDAHLPAEFRPGLTHEDAPPVVRREKRPVEVTYYATLDTFTTTGQTVVHCWYRVREGRHAGRIEPWPPRRSSFGALYTRDIPEGLTEEERRAFSRRYFDECRAIRAAAETAIAEHPGDAAALFAARQSACCCCGRPLTDKYSMTYGIGPECRAGLPADVLTRLAERTARAHGQAAEAGADD